MSNSSSAADAASENRARQGQEWRIGVPTPAALLFAGSALAVLLIASAGLLHADGDEPRHLKVGGYILEHARIPHVDTFSYTMWGQSYTPAEWLGETVMAAASHVGGLAGVGVLCGLVIATTGLLLHEFMRRRGIDPLLNMLVTATAVILTGIHWTARPHLFTLPAVVLLLYLLEARSTHFMVLAGLFVVWANVHGGFLYGLVLITIYLFADLWAGYKSLWDPASAKTAWNRLGALSVASLATLINPVGFHLHTRLLGVLRNQYLMSASREFHSPNFHLIGSRPFLLIFLMVLCVLALRHRQLELKLIVILVANIYLALQSARHIPLFAVVGLPLLTVHGDADWRALKQRLLVKARSAVALGELRGVTYPWVMGTVALLVILAMNSGTMLGVQWTPSVFDKGRFPVAAVQRARASQLGGHVFTRIDWGGYVVYAWPEAKVFLDGETLLYGERLTRIHEQIVQLNPGWRAALHETSAQIVVIQSESKLAAQLQGESNWKEWYRDPIATVFVATAHD